MGKNLVKIIFAEGIFFTLLGVLILLIPQVISIWTVLLISIVLVLGGIYKLVNSIMLRKEHDNPWVSSIVGLLCVLSGIYIKLNPYFSLIVFTAMIATYLVLDGVYSITTSINIKKYSKLWGISFLSGILQITLALLIIFWMPQLSLITIGILIGVNMLTGGIGLIFMGFGFNKITNPN